MDVILLQKINKLGDLGEKVSVKSGYARNFLIPSGKATTATAENIKLFEQRRAELEKAEKQLLEKAQQRAKQLEGLVVTIYHKAGEEGRLFGSVGTTDIADSVSKAGVEIAKNEVRLPNGALRQTGEYEIDLHLHTDVNASVQIVVVAEE